ncbi:MAG TPA: GNAT family N-acetyltransferase [Chloroflexaceae bacterium]|nr:GNAT family N-acetyltransferase [Chloroflexaceae bacterium]
MLILETERLALRRLLPADFDALFALYGDPEIRRYFPEGTLTREQAREELEWFLDGHPNHPELGLWATIHRPSGRFIGRCGLLPWTIDGREEVEVAYLLDKRFWGQGLATEAARAIAAYAFERLGLQRLVCLIDPRNQASIGVARRIGMALEQAREDEKGPYLLYAMARPPRELAPVEEAGILALEGEPAQPYLATAEDARRLVEACWSSGAGAALLYPPNLTPGFFDLSTGEAGAILQKLQNYRIRLAVVCPPGDVPMSSRFRELLAEAQGGRDFGLFPTREAARAWLAG